MAAGEEVRRASNDYLSDEFRFCSHGLLSCLEMFHNRRSNLPKDPIAAIRTLDFRRHVKLLGSDSGTAVDAFVDEPPRIPFDWRLAGWRRFLLENVVAWT